VVLVPDQIDVVPRGLVQRDQVADLGEQLGDLDRLV
jgi:hypothetical protein